MKAVPFILLSLLPFHSSMALAAEGKQGHPLAGIPARAPEPRVALIVGNGNYPGTPLPHPVNDARAIAAALQKLQFDVTKKENVSQKELYDAVSVFGDRLRRGGVGLFYFGGYGLQSKGRNFLIPVGAAIKEQNDIPRLGVDLAHIVETTEGAKNLLNIIIVDASRDNPLTRRIKSVEVGLAPVDAPAGSIIAFSAAPNSLSIEAKGPNSLYSQHLLANLIESGLKIEEVFERVRAGISKDTNGKQVPWEDLSLVGDFYMNLSTTAVRREGMPGVAKKNDVGVLYKKASSGDKASLQELTSLAAAGNAFAQTSLGNMYHAGLGVNKDSVEAAKWYRMAADQGDAIGQNLLGFMYENGQGVTKNREEAARWYRKAAEQGIADAKRALARLGQ